jgi:hypothetical protein
MLLKLYVPVILVLVCLLQERSASSFFTASANMAKLVETERLITRNIRDFIKKIKDNKEEAELLINFK